MVDVMDEEPTLPSKAGSIPSAGLKQPPKVILDGKKTFHKAWHLLQWGNAGALYPRF